VQLDFLQRTKKLVFSQDTVTTSERSY